MRAGRHRDRGSLRACVRRLLGPARARWQKPAAVVRALGLGRGDTVGEIGAGPGYFTLRLARAVGPRGRVFAVDPDLRMLDRLARRLRRHRTRNVTPVVGRDDDPLLPPGSCDLLLVVNAYHHFADGPALLRRLVPALRPGGRLANVDFHDRDAPVGPPPGHRVSRETFLRDARRAGLRLTAERDFLPYQYFLILTRNVENVGSDPRRLP
jgi:ubiquinone/menaquinone biosynthesis C-methylase UbiE